MQVALLGGGADVLQHPVLQFHILVLDNDLENAVELGHVELQKIQVLLLDLNDLRRLDSFNKKTARLAGMKAADVCYPIIFCGKLDVVLCALVVNGVHPETALHHKRVVLTGEAFLQNHLPPFDFPLRCPGCYQFLFLFFQREVFLKMVNEWLHGFLFCEDSKRDGSYVNWKIARDGSGFGAD